MRKRNSKNVKHGGRLSSGGPIGKNSSSISSDNKTSYVECKFKTKPFAE